MRSKYGLSCVDSDVDNRLTLGSYATTNEGERQLGTGPDEADITGKLQSSDTNADLCPAS